VGNERLVIPHWSFTDHLLLSAHWRELTLAVGYAGNEFVLTVNTMQTYIVLIVLMAVSYGIAWHDRPAK